MNEQEIKNESNKKLKLQKLVLIISATILGVYYFSGLMMIFSGKSNITVILGLRSAMYALLGVILIIPAIMSAVSYRMIFYPKKRYLDFLLILLHICISLLLAFVLWKLDF